MTVSRVAVATNEFKFDVCNCTVGNDVGTGDFSLVLGVLHVCAIARVCGHGLLQ